MVKKATSRPSRSVSVISGSEYVNLNIGQYSTGIYFCETTLYTCYSESECGLNRCECNAKFGMDIVRYLSNGGSPDLRNFNPQAGVCGAKMRMVVTNSVGSDHCCGEAPNWRSYNSVDKKCVDGELIAL